MHLGLLYICSRDREAKRKEDEVRGIDFTLRLHCGDTLPLIISGGVEELIWYSIVMEGSHLSPRKPKPLTSFWSIFRAAVTMLATATHLINLLAEDVQAVLQGVRLISQRTAFSAQGSKVTGACGGLRCYLDIMMDSNNTGCWIYLAKNASLLESIFILFAALCLDQKWYYIWSAHYSWLMDGN